MHCMIETCNNNVCFVKQTEEGEKDIELCNEHLHSPEFAYLLEPDKCSKCYKKPGQTIAEDETKRTLLCADCATLPKYKDLPQSPIQTLA